MSMSLLDFLERQQQVMDMKVKTKKEFGIAMHTDIYTDEEKKEIVKQLEAMGGYSCLAE